MHELFDAYRLDEVSEEGWLVGNEAVPETVRRRGEADDAERWIDPREVGDERAVASLVLVAHQVALVDDHEIDVTDFGGALPNRLDARERDGLAELLPTNACRVDAHRRARPMLAHLLRVLLDELLNVREHEHARLRPTRERVAAERGDDVALPCAGWEHEARVPGRVRAEPRIKLVDGALLVVPKRDGHPTTFASNLRRS